MNWRRMFKNCSTSKNVFFNFYQKTRETPFSKNYNENFKNKTPSREKLLQ